MAEHMTLAALRDIHLPAPIGLWPVAPGWIVLVMLVVVLLFSSVWFIWRFYRYRLGVRIALRLLNTYEKQAIDKRQSHASVVQATILLKRVALHYYPRVAVASLHGDDWITFLNKSSKKLDFNMIRSELLVFPYQASTESRPLLLPDDSLFFTMIRSWIKQRRKPCSS
jgi:hypothetical protein